MMDGRTGRSRVFLFQEILTFYNPTPALPRREGGDILPKIRNEAKVLPLGEDLGGVKIPNISIKFQTVS